METTFINGQRELGAEALTPNINKILGALFGNSNMRHQGPYLVVVSLKWTAYFSNLRISLPCLVQADFVHKRNACGVSGMKFSSLSWLSHIAPPQHKTSFLPSSQERSSQHPWPLSSSLFLMWKPIICQAACTPAQATVIWTRAKSVHLNDLGVVKGSSCNSGQFCTPAGLQYFFRPGFFPCPGFFPWPRVFFVDTKFHSFKKKFLNFNYYFIIVHFFPTCILWIFCWVKLQFHSAF